MRCHVQLKKNLIFVLVCIMILIFFFFRFKESNYTQAYVFLYTTCTFLIDLHFCLMLNHNKFFILWIRICTWGENNSSYERCIKLYFTFVIYFFFNRFPVFYRFSNTKNLVLFIGQSVYIKYVFVFYFCL